MIKYVIFQEWKSKLFYKNAEKVCYSTKMKKKYFILRKWQKSMLFNKNEGKVFCFTKKCRKSMLVYKKKKNMLSYRNEKASYYRGRKKYVVLQK